MRRHSVLPRVLRAWVLLLLLTLAMPAQAAALTVYSASVKNSYCSGSYSWKGDVPYENAWDAYYYQTTGTVKYCFWVYRVTDSDPNGDYYVVAERVTWTTTYDGATRGDNFASITLSSSIAAKNSVYEGAPDANVRFSGNCSASTSFSVSYGIFSVSVSETFCSSGQLNVSSIGSSSARWTSPDVTRTPKWEVAYMIKVPNGAKPKLTASLSIPRYSAYRDSQTLYWKYSKIWTSVSRSYTIP
jgi:hypothetical protein